MNSGRLENSICKTQLWRALQGCDMEALLSAYLNNCSTGSRPAFEIQNTAKLSGAVGIIASSCSAACKLHVHAEADVPMTTPPTIYTQQQHQVCTCH